MLYIYQFEDGSIKWSADAPTSGDLECVGNGILCVFRTDGTKLEEVDQNDDWSECEEAEQVMVCGCDFHQ